MTRTLGGCAALDDWFSDDSYPSVCQPVNMLAVAFETDATEESSSEELAEIRRAAVQRYLRDCASKS